MSLPDESLQSKGITTGVILLVQCSFNRPLAIVQPISEVAFKFGPANLLCFSRVMIRAMFLLIRPHNHLERVDLHSSSGLHPEPGASGAGGRPC